MTTERFRISCIAIVLPSTIPPSPVVRSRCA
jgi:hypothetical protein